MLGFLPPQISGYSDGCFSNNILVYFTPFSNATNLNSTKILRLDLTKIISSAAAWDVFSFGSLSKGVQNFKGCLFDKNNQNMYLIPNTVSNGTLDTSSMHVRYNTSLNFLLNTSWSFYDSNPTTGLKTGGFGFSAYDEKYIYYTVSCAKKKF